MSSIQEQFERLCEAGPQAEHAWLTQLVGEWEYESSCPAGPGEQAQTFAGTERVRSLGGLWVIAEGRGEMPDGGEALSVITLGYDPRKRRYVGTWIGSMMDHHWVCDGELDQGGRILSLHSDGPVTDAQGRPVRFKDVIEIVSDDERTLNGYMLGEDGQWQAVMTARYRRRG